MSAPPRRGGGAPFRLATAWLGGCSGCHMSFLDLDGFLLELAGRAELVYGPLVDAKAFPEEVDATLVEGAVSTADQLDLARRIRAGSRIVVALGDCAANGNVTALRNRIPVGRLLEEVRGEGGGPGAGAGGAMPALLPEAVPLHRAIAVDAFVPGCPPDRERIRAALLALLEGRGIALPPEMRTFG